VHQNYSCEITGEITTDVDKKYNIFISELHTFLSQKVILLTVFAANLHYLTYLIYI